MTFKSEAVQQAAQIAPPAVPVGLSIAGIPVADVVWVLTGLYVVLQVALILPKLYREYFKGGGDGCPK